MPVIVVGADTPQGEAIVGRLVGTAGELRTFVSSAETGETMRATGAKVAIGDVSDGSHVMGAALGCFTAVIVTQAARDDRTRSFTDSPGETIAAWIAAVTEAGVERVIVVGGPGDLETIDTAGGIGPTVVTVSTGGLDPSQIAEACARLDAARNLDEV